MQWTVISQWKRVTQSYLQHHPWVTSRTQTRTKKQVAYNIIPLMESSNYARLRNRWLRTHSSVGRLWRKVSEWWTQNWTRQWWGERVPSGKNTQPLSLQWQWPGLVLKLRGWSCKFLIVCLVAHGYFSISFVSMSHSNGCQLAFLFFFFLHLGTLIFPLCAGSFSQGRSDSICTESNMLSTVLYNGNINGFQP